MSIMKRMELTVEQPPIRQSQFSQLPQVDRVESPQTVFNALNLTSTIILLGGRPVRFSNHWPNSKAVEQRADIVEGEIKILDKRRDR